MDFISHGIQGGCLYSIPVRMLSQNDTLTAVAFVYGFIEGSSPDTFDWIADKVSVLPRWILYGVMHNDYQNHWWGWLPALRLHVEVDKPFHSVPGSWWPREWFRAVCWWALSLAGLFLAFF